MEDRDLNDFKTGEILKELFKRLYNPFKWMGARVRYYLNHLNSKKAVFCKDPISLKDLEERLFEYNRLLGDRPGQIHAILTNEAALQRVMDDHELAVRIERNEVSAHEIVRIRSELSRLRQIIEVYRNALLDVGDCSHILEALENAKLRSIIAVYEEALEQYADSKKWDSIGWDRENNLVSQFTGPKRGKLAYEIAQEALERGKK